MCEERIVRYTLDELPADGGTDWERVRAMTDEEIERNAAEDPDNPLLTAEELAEMVLMHREMRDPLPNDFPGLIELQQWLARGDA